VHDEVLAFLEKNFLIIANHTRETLDREEVLTRCSQTDGLMAFMPDRIDEAFLSRCPRLKVIAAALKGYDNIDVQACTRLGIRFSFVRDLLTGPTAELAAALLLGLSRAIITGDRMVRSGEFRGWRPVLYGRGISGSTVGIVGMGAIGRALAAKLSGFGCSLVYCDPRPLDAETESALALIPMELDDLLDTSDYIVVCAPLTPDSLHLINASTLGRVKPGSYMINIGRGSVVDESAVALALASGRLAGYAADVFEFEDWARDDRPAMIHPDLIAHNDKTLFTPHLGSAVDAVRREIALEAAHNITSALANGLEPYQDSN
jgi:phosphonate dehydrogenase